MNAEELAEIVARIAGGVRRKLEIREGHRAKLPDVDTDEHLAAMRALVVEIEAESVVAATHAARGDDAGAGRSRKRADALQVKVSELDRQIMLAYRADRQIREWAGL